MELTGSNGLDRATTEMIERAFNEHMSIAHENLNSEQVIDQSRAFITATRQFMKRMGISQLKPNEGIMFMNGKLLEFDEERVKFKRMILGNPNINLLSSHGFIL